MDKILQIFHKHCSGSIDEKGNCELSSRNFRAVAIETMFLIEETLKDCGGWNESVVDAIRELKA